MAKRALIIDDDIDLCLLLTRFLNKNGFETSSAHSGAKGIALYDPANFDVVICDYRLDDMDGIKLIKVIKLGAYDYITKPLIPDEVLSILNNLSNKSEDKAVAASQLAEQGTNAKRKSNVDFYKGKSPASVFL